MPNTITTKRSQHPVRTDNYVCKPDAIASNTPQVYKPMAQPAPKKPPVKVTSRSSSARCNRAVQLAEQEWNPQKAYEVHGSNRGPDITRYRYGVDKDYAWCASFFNYLYNPKHVPGQNVFGMSDKDVMSTQKILRKAKEEHCFADAKSRYQPQVGDALIWTNLSDRGKGHIGIIVEVRSDGSFVTIQGNNHDKVEKVEYKSVYDAMTRVSSQGNVQSLQGFAQMSKYNNNHNLAANIDSKNESLINPDSGYCWVT